MSSMTRATAVAEPQLRVLALGAGVQSLRLALRAAHGEIGPMDWVVRIGLATAAAE